MQNNNVSEEQLEHYLKECNVKPRSFHVISTVNVVTDENDIILVEDDDTSTMSEWQYIMAVGTGVEDWSPGDKVLLDLDKLKVRVVNPENRMETIETLRFNPIPIGDKFFNIIPESAVLAKEHKYEDIEL